MTADSAQFRDSPFFPGQLVAHDGRRKARIEVTQRETDRVIRRGVRRLQETFDITFNFA